MFTSATNNAITDSGNNSYNVTDATYDDSTGDLVLTTPAASALSINDTITIAANSITFTCEADKHATLHPYPRTTDPAYNTPVTVTNVTGTTITVNVIDAAMLSKVAVYLNGRRVSVNNLTQYSRLYSTPTNETLLIKTKISP